MSQQAAAGQGAGMAGRGMTKGRGGKPRFQFQRDGNRMTKAFKSTITEIVNDTFNMGQNKFAAQFTQSRKNMVNYLQRTSDEGYLVAQMVRTGEKQIIELPVAVDPNSPTAADDELIRQKLVKAVGKRQMKLSESLMKRYATMYGQCYDGVKENFEASSDWQRIQDKQSLHKFIQKIERVCIGFDDHKQEVYNLVQSLKMLFLYTQNKKHTVKEYGRNFRSLWDTVKAFGGSPGLHKGMINTLMQDPTKVAGTTRPTDKEIKRVHAEALEAVKAALFISEADKQRYGRLKEDLVNNYLLGSNQYPDTFKKGHRILGNYQGPRNMCGFRGNHVGGVAFIQRGRGTGRTSGQGKAPGHGGTSGNGSATGNDGLNTSGLSSAKGVRPNSKGESHCYNCGELDH
jgi:hypothetical protein